MILALTGKKGVGKTTAANYVNQKYGFHRRSFADPLKKLAMTMFSLTEEDFKIENKERSFRLYPWTPRELLLNLGKFCRYHDKDYMIRHLIQSLESTSQNYVIDDLRLKREADALKLRKTKIVRINRYPDLNPYVESEDITETDMDGYSYDYVIEDCNNITILDLRKQIDSILADLGLI